MIILGLTGSIGMGKSTAASMLGYMGCGVYDADQAARNALNPKGEAFEEVALTFPAAWDKKTRTIKRDVLAEIIFQDSEKKKILEDIIHPIVQNNQWQFIQQEKRLGRKSIVLDIPLLFETFADDNVNYTIVVTAPQYIQRQRVLKRAGMSEEKFENILKTQMPDRQKRYLADFIIPTGMGMAYTYQSLIKMMQQINTEAII